MVARLQCQDDGALRTLDRRARQSQLRDDVQSDAASRGHSRRGRYIRVQAMDERARDRLHCRRGSSGHGNGDPNKDTRSERHTQKSFKNSAPRWSSLSRIKRGEAEAAMACNPHPPHFQPAGTGGPRLPPTARVLARARATARSIRLGSQCPPPYQHARRHTARTRRWCARHERRTGAHVRCEPQRRGLRTHGAQCARARLPRGTFGRRVCMCGVCLSRV